MRIKKSLVIIFVLVSFIFSLHAENKVDARMLPYDSPIYDYMDMLYSYSGLAKPNTNRPWSESQARVYLSKINKSSLDDDYLSFYTKAEEIINEGLKWNIDPSFGVSVGLTFNLEGYYHNNSLFDTEDEWVRSWNDRKSLMRVYFEASSYSNFYTSADILYRYGRAASPDHYGYLQDLATNDGYIGSYKVDDSDVGYVISSKYFRDNFATNFYTDTRSFSFIWPNRAIFSIGGTNWNVSFNRDRLKIGDSHFGSLLVDNHSDYNDYFRTTFSNPHFTYDWILLSLNTLTSDSEDEVKESRVYMIHTLDFRLWDKFSLKLSENVMWKYSVFDLGTLNPSFFFHQLNNRSLFNALAYIEVNANIIKGLDIFGQFALDQARAPNEGYSQSDSLGYSFGVEYRTEAPKGAIEVYGEYLYTSPLLYRRDKVDFIKVSRYYHLDSDNDTSGHIPFFEYIGYRYGGDTRAAKIGVNYLLPPFGKLEFYTELMEHGEMSIFTSHNVNGNNDDDANIGGNTPYGEKITRALIISLKGDVELSSMFSWPEVGGYFEIDWITRSSYSKSSKKYSDTNSDLQISLGVTLGL